MQQPSYSSSMAPPFLFPQQPAKKKNHTFIVKVLVPPKVSATVYDMESYLEWMTPTVEKNHKFMIKELSDLPDDLMESILERLSSADRIGFGATCKKNLSFVTTQHHSPRYQFRTIDKLPWMATFAPSGSVVRLFEPLQQRGRPNYANYQIHDPNGEELRSINACKKGWLELRSIKACKKGWFLCLRREFFVTSFLLFCPFNKRIIKLPDLDCKISSLDHLCQATFSSDDPSSPDCVFFVLWSREICTYCIATLDQKSRKWNTKLFDKLIGFVESVVYHEGCFYCLSIKGELAAYDVFHQTWNLIIAPSPLSDLRYYRIAEKELVVCEGKLILAFVGLANSRYNDLEAFCCGLFEFSSFTNTWVEKTSLGDHALFLRNPASFCVPVPACSNVANRMYFCNFKMDEDCPIYYSFKDGRCHMPENGDYWSNVGRGRWIEPLPSS